MSTMSTATDLSAFAPLEPELFSVVCTCFGAATSSPAPSESSPHPTATSPRARQARIGASSFFKGGPPTRDGWDSVPPSASRHGSCADQQLHQRLLGVQPVLGLVPDRRAVAVEDLGGDLLARMGRQAVQRDHVVAGPLEQCAVEPVRPE